MICVRLHLLFLHVLALHDLCTSAGSQAETGNALVGCAACQGLTVKDFKCDVNCEVLENNGMFCFIQVLCFWNGHLKHRDSLLTARQGDNAAHLFACLFFNFCWGLPGVWCTIIFFLHFQTHCDIYLYI